MDACRTSYGCANHALRAFQEGIGMPPDPLLLEVQTWGTTVVTRQGCPQARLRRETEAFGFKGWWVRKSYQFESPESFVFKL